MWLNFFLPHCKRVLGQVDNHQVGIVQVSHFSISGVHIFIIVVKVTSIAPLYRAEMLSLISAAGVALEEAPRGPRLHPLHGASLLTPTLRALRLMLHLTILAIIRTLIE